MKRNKITKAALTVEMLLKGYSVPEIMEEMLKVFPGSGTTENSIYYYASKTPGVSLSQRNDKVDSDALATLRAKLNPVVPTPEVEETKEEEPSNELSAEEELEAMKAQIRAEIEAEYAARPKVRIRKKADLVG
jgi:hypothetical protein